SGLASVVPLSIGNRDGNLVPLGHLLDEPLISHEIACHVDVTVEEEETDGKTRGDDRIEYISRVVVLLVV
ncbi:hypothetical protein PMAYCL1PPCAC_03057, partial [Pristionchus mayeri]